MDTKARLEQVLRDREIANDAFNEEILAIKAMLAEEAKLKLKDGDYGYASHFNRKAPADPRMYLGGHHLGCHGGECDDSPLEFISGNWLDDLKRNSKDLREFEVSAQNLVEGFTARVSTDNGETPKVVIKIMATNNWCYTLEKVQEIHQKLGNLIATAKRDAAKK